MEETYKGRNWTLEEGVELTRSYLDKYIRDSVFEVLDYYKFKIDALDLETEYPLYAPLYYQFIYILRVDKAYIQIDWDDDKHYIDNDRELLEKILNRISANLQYDTTGISPEVLSRNQKSFYRTIENYKNYQYTNKKLPVSTNRQYITPYVIGYWEALDGVMEVIEDKSVVTLDAIEEMLPPDNPTKTWDQFYDICMDINREFHLIKNNDQLSREDKNEYIRRARIIQTETHCEGQEYVDRMNELNEEYLQTPYNNENLVNAMERYYEEYKNFFGFDLREQQSGYKKYKLGIMNIE